VRERERERERERIGKRRTTVSKRRDDVGRLFSEIWSFVPKSEKRKK
jgi:hypothetical protein